jgi:hypothetical protein
MAKINEFHVSLFAEFLAKLKATPEGERHLLDHSLYLTAAASGILTFTTTTNLPILVAGGARGRNERRTSHQVCEADTAGQSPPHPAREAGVNSSRLRIAMARVERAV